MFNSVRSNAGTIEIRRVMPASNNKGISLRVITTGVVRIVMMFPVDLAKL